MGLEAKKNVLRMIPYGLYVLMTENNEGKVAASTVNWVTQTSFDPPLLAVAIKKDSQTYALVREKGLFSLNMLVNTPGGRSYTAKEVTEWLRRAGFRSVSFRRSKGVPDSGYLFARLPK